MKVVKINSLGCPSCIIMNKVFNKIKEKYTFDLEELDYDFDEIDEYEPGNILPIYIFYKDNKEITRLVGEHKLEELEKIFEENKWKK